MGLYRNLSVMSLDLFLNEPSTICLWIPAAGCSCRSEEPTKKLYNFNFGILTLVTHWKQHNTGIINIIQSKFNEIPSTHYNQRCII